MSRIILLCLGITFTVATAQTERPDKIVADFEGKDYGVWKATGEAFGPGPARGTLPGQMPVSGYEGEGLVNSFFRGDRTTGTLTSPEFRIERGYLTFLIGGGHHPGKACMNLLLDGKVVRTATGPNRQPGGTEALEPDTWNVAEFEGKTVRLEIVDQVTGGWGHINIDHIVQTDRKPAVVPREVHREIVADKRYLVLPVQTGQPKRRVALLLDGQPWREFEIELPGKQTDLHAVVDLAPVRGQRLTLRAERVPEKLPGWQGIVASENLPDTETAYREKHRPGYHYTSRRGWLNDPNGLVFLDGEWHLFYQHNPYGWAWGNMHWGHAVSKNLLHWKEQPIAIYPPRFGDWAFSGSAVVDRENTSGWKQGDTDVLVAAWTSTGRGECISYSTDRGKTWSEYEGNPVVKHQGRDPRLLWHAPSKQWVMAVYTEAEGKRWIAFHTSPDLKKWTYQSRIDGFYECPDFFELPLDREKGQTLWILYGADGQYLLGDFDGKTFKPTTPTKQQLWYGNFYAAQTFSNAPGGRRIQIGWGQGITFPGMPFNQQMNIPCELRLQRTATGVELCALPVREVSHLHVFGQTVQQRQTELPADKPVSLKAPEGDLFDVRLIFACEAGAQVTFTLRGASVVYDAKAERLTCRGKAMPLKRADGMKLRILIDRGSLEIFAGDGNTALVAGGLLPEERTFSLVSKGGTSTVQDLVIDRIKSVWE